MKSEVAVSKAISRKGRVYGNEGGEELFGRREEKKGNEKKRFKSEKKREGRKETSRKEGKKQSWSALWALVDHRDSPLTGLLIE